MPRSTIFSPNLVVVMYSIISLGLPGAKILRIRRTFNRSGYYAELLRTSRMGAQLNAEFLLNVEFVQVNEIYCRGSTLYGLRIHPSLLMRRLVRVVAGDVIFLALDLRLSSMTFGHILGHKVTVCPDNPFSEWIWLPGGFAFGIVAVATSIVECYCSVEGGPSDEISMSMLAPDLQWGLCEPALRADVQAFTSTYSMTSDHDRYGLTLAEWQREHRFSAF